MNCDEAFDALTATDSRSSDELQQHLLNCPRCREMNLFSTRSRYKL